jgi:hypothetical protein
MTCLFTGRFERPREIHIISGIICNMVLIILKQLNLLIIVKLIVGLLVKKFSSSYVTLPTFVSVSHWNITGLKILQFCFQWLTENKYISKISSCVTTFVIYNNGYQLKEQINELIHITDSLSNWKVNVTAYGGCSCRFKADCQKKL